MFTLVQHVGVGSRVRSRKNPKKIERGAQILGGPSRRGYARPLRRPSASNELDSARVKPFQRRSDSSVPFPGAVQPREAWTRTRVGLGDPGRQFDWEAAFGRRARHVIDLGCGNGRYLIASALRRADCDHLGVELVPPALRLGSLRAGQRALTNCKFAWGDASEFIVSRAAPGSIDEAHLYHPQPYYERSKIDRRQLTPRILAALHRALAPGGVFVFQTDNPAFMRYAREVVPALFAWSEVEGAWPDDPGGRTLREIVARSQGLAILRAQAVKLELADDEVARRCAVLAEPEFDANKAGYGADERLQHSREFRRKPRSRRR